MYRTCLLLTQSGHWLTSSSLLPVDASGIHMPWTVSHRSNFAEDWEQEVVLSRANAHGLQGGTTLKKIVVAAVIAIWCVPSATLAGERVGDAALGALSGAVVLGPVGAVAGAVIGYTAGPSIADSWGLRRSEPRQSAKLPPKTTSKRVSSTQVNPPADPRRGASARDIPTPPVKPSSPSDDAKLPINGLQM